MPNTAIYCPGLDDQMSGWIDQMVARNWVARSDVHAGGGRSLDTVQANTKLYILCHGHAEMPLFATEAGKWTAKELALMLVNDGLTRQLRNMEMLVCHAGESVTTRKAAKQRLAIYHQAMSARGSNDESLFQKLRKKYTNVVSKGPKPSLFTHESQVLPMSAQLVQELKYLGFNYIQVTAYKAAVRPFFYEPGDIRLDLSPKGGKWDAKATPEYTVTWR